MLHSGSVYVVIDSVYDGIRLPQDIGVRILHSIEDAFPSARNYKIGVSPLGVQVFYPYNNAFNVNSIPNYTLTISKALTLQIKGKDLFAETAVEISGRQIHGFRSLFLFGPNIKEIYLGIPFMKRYHIVFDSENLRIGFGKCIDDEVLNRLSSKDMWTTRRNSRYYSTHIVVIIVLITTIIAWMLYQHRRKRVKKRRKRSSTVHNTITTIRSHEELIEPFGRPMITIEPT